MDPAEEPPTSIDPYEVLEIDPQASDDTVKKAYRTLALKHHPDKAQGPAKAKATEKFQEIAFAYAILSDTRRRRRYDTTGSTAESLLDEDDDFDWLQFYRDQFESVTSERIEDFKTSYQGSEEERKDILAAYEKSRGDMTKLYQNVMLSNVMDDDSRFRAVIDKAIEDNEIKPCAAYTEETEKSKEKRLKDAKKQAAQAEKRLKKIKSEKLARTKSKTKGASVDSDADLLAMIQANKQKRSDSFLANLEAKYAAEDSRSRGKGSRKRNVEMSEPPEEAFERNAKRKSNRGSKA